MKHLVLGETHREVRLTLRLVLDARVNGYLEELLLAYASGECGWGAVE